MTPETIAAFRETLGKWGTYGPTSYGAGWTPLPVDEMTDEQVVEAARKIATEGKDSC